MQYRHCFHYHRQFHMYGIFRFIILSLLISLLLPGCSSGSSSSASESGELRDPTPVVLTPTASGTTTYGNDVVLLDASNTSEGYIMVNYSGSNEKVKLQIVTPDETTYTYTVSVIGDYAVYPLSGGSGAYKVSVLESASIEENLYAVVFTQDLDVTITNEFSPFLYPNYYINFSQDSSCVSKGQELAEDCYSDLDVVTNIYNYVIEHITYDNDKAENVSSGYVPDPDETLSTGTGICFDYASLMSSMLRSQNIPTKLEVGYSGDVYHAWISCYVDEIGWVDNIIQFDGENWSLIDPTLGANNSSSSVKDYIGDGSNYMTKYTY